jgi:nifR3 family TIM-barrel protein
MGCPANKVLKGCSGAALMGDLSRAARIIEACRKTLTIPLTVKFRLGLGAGPTPVNFLELGHIAEDLGVAAVTLHARTAKQMFSGPARWEDIRRLKEHLSIPVIGNGDVRTPEDVLSMFRATGCDAVMIGRAALHDPWIFRRAEAALRGDPAPVTTGAERRAAILAYFRWIVRDEEPREALHKLRVFTGWFTRGLAGGRQLRGLMPALTTPAQFLEAAEEHLAPTQVG